MNNANVTNMKTLVANYKNDIIAFVYNGVDYTKRRAITDLVVNDLGIRTLNRFSKFKFEQYEMSDAQLVALLGLQKKLVKYMSKPQPVAKKVKAKKVAKKKAVAKKKTAKVTLKDKYTKLYKIVANYSDNLMQDVYSVVYRTKELKRFINTALATKFIEQEVLVRIGEHSMKESKKTKLLKAELEQEFA
jgi:hypothetical protein